MRTEIKYLQIFIIYDITYSVPSGKICKLFQCFLRWEQAECWVFEDFFCALVYFWASNYNVVDR